MVLQKVIAALSFFGFSSVLGLHCGEQDDLTDGVGASEQHDGTVDAHAHAARGRHAVFHSGEIGRASCRERV